MVQSNTSIWAAITSTQTVKYETKGLRIRLCIWDAQLKRGTVSTNWSGDAGARKVKEEENICGAFQQRIRPWHIMWALTIMDNGDERHHIRKNLPQKSVHHQSRSYTRGPSNLSSRKVGGLAQRLHATPTHRNNPRIIEANWDHTQARLDAEGSETTTQEPPKSTTKP